MKSSLNISSEAYVESVIKKHEPVFDHTLLTVLILQQKTIRPCCETSKWKEYRLTVKSNSIF